MHRFRKKQDLKKLEYNNNNNSLTTKESQISTSTTVELPTLPPASDFRTSLILPTLTKRFSVLRRGEKANNHIDTSTNVTKTTSIAQESPDTRTLLSNSQINNEKKDNNVSTTNEVSKIKGKREILFFFLYYNNFFLIFSFLL